MPREFVHDSAGAGPRSAQPDALFRASADQAPLVMWIIDAQGQVTYLNRSWYQLVGGAPPQWYGNEWMKACHPDDVQQMREGWELARDSGAIFEGTRRVRAQDGSWHTLSYRATPVYDDEGLACWVGMDTDITEMAATQAALRFANQELEAFSYTVSHDLRTPLVTLQGFCKRLTQELAGDAQPSKVQHYLQRIQFAGEVMGRLIDGLLTLSHVTRRKLRVENVDVSRLATETLDTFARAEPQRAARFDIEPALEVQADSRLIGALLDNLLGNAWKFTSTQAATEIAVGLASRSDSEIVLSVRDNGVGFDMAASKKLFTAFERLHAANEFPGTGIGLATAHRIVTRHGGRMWAESVLGQGACFYFALPVLKR